MEKSESLCNLDFLYKFTKGDDKKVATYIQTYLRTSERIFEELGKAGSSGNAGDMYVKAHTVKPQVQYMGISSLQEVLIEIENLSKSDPTSQRLGELVDQATTIYHNSSEELRTRLAAMHA